MESSDVIRKLAAYMQVYRKSHRLSSEECAKELGISKTQVLNIERGKANPTIATLELIARSIGTDIPTILGESDLPRLTNSMFLMSVLEDGHRYSLDALFLAAEHMVAALTILSNDQKRWSEREAASDEKPHT